MIFKLICALVLTEINVSVKPMEIYKIDYGILPYGKALNMLNTATEPDYVFVVEGSSISHDSALSYAAGMSAHQLPCEISNNLKTKIEEHFSHPDAALPQNGERAVVGILIKP